MSKAAAAEEEDEDECFYESLDRILTSSSCSCSTSNSDDDTDDISDSDAASANYASRRRFPTPRFPMEAYKYDVWISEPASVSDRRSRLLREMRLSGDPALSRAKPETVGRSVSSDHLIKRHCAPAVSQIVRSKSDGVEQCNGGSSSPPILCSETEAAPAAETNSFVNTQKQDCVCKSASGKSNGSSAASPPPLNKPPSGRNSRRCDEIRIEVEEPEEEEELECNGGSASEVCTIRNLDNGKEFVVNEIREDGMWNKLKEVGTGKQLTMEEFEMSVGHSPIVQELMRRQNVEESHKGGGGGSDSNANGGGGGVPKMKKRGWFKSIKSVASSVTGHKERRSSDERDTSSEKGGRRSSSATDDSQDVSFHGPERVRVRQYGKSCKELTAVYKTQEIQAHNGSIWSIKFSLDGKYLASAGEDCVIHIWQVMETERKGDLLMQKSEDNNLDLLFIANGSSEPSSVSPNSYSHLEKKRRGRTSISRKSLSLEHYVIPETMFALSEKPISSFQGHVDDVLDLSWSKSQHLLSSSMDKTVRLWHLSSKSCLRKFSHIDYVTCIQFNPVDDNYFISGSLDAKVRIWSILDHQVVDWNDTHEMVTAACYTPDGQGALVGTYKGSCRLYNTSDNKLQEKNQINLQNKKKKSHHKKITGFQFAPGSSSEVLVTSADSRIRVVDGVDLVHKFKGFRNTNSQISATLTANGKYVVSASEDSHVYIWKHEADSRPSRSKSVTVTRSYEHFHSHNVSVAVSWPGVGDSWGLQDGEQNGLGLDTNLDEVSTANHPPTPVEEANGKDGSRSASGCTNSPLHGTITSASNSYFFDRISATYPEEKLLLATKKRSPRVSFDFSNGVSQNIPAWGMVIVTAGLGGEIRTFQNFGLPIRI
ncbi:PREDICTED: WD repeat-containing protein 44 [Fragaria vesca subsp. vesca]|uniref:WD repeat-containing protein 44 n=1 Tax=Fragaria vesca subsp. vesca TaxID=101020 RepID=UPI0002C2E600|nr:PREDICTED: WD repeat-containing protein 44 [Fragaria vesca subsp. vesca]